MKAATRAQETQTDLCKGHGGGKRCIHLKAANKSAAGPTDLCKGHGGGKRCIHLKAATKSAQGRTDHCIAHGGGPRCEHPDHVVSAIEPILPYAGFRVDGIQLCHQHYYMDPSNTCKAIRREIVLLGSVLTGTSAEHGDGQGIGWA